MEVIILLCVICSLLLAENNEKVKGFRAEDENKNETRDLFPTQFVSIRHKTMDEVKREERRRKRLDIVFHNVKVVQFSFFAFLQLNSRARG